MNRIIRASAISGAVLVVLFFVFVGVRSSDPIDTSLESLVGLLLVTVFLWAVGAVVAFVLLIPLTPIADRLRPWFSLPLFLLIGFSFPAWLQHQWLQIGAHGDPPAIETQPWMDLALTIVSAGLMGLGCSLASWLSIRRSARNAAAFEEIEDA